VPGRREEGKEGGREGKWEITCKNRKTYLWSHKRTAWHSTTGKMSFVVDIHHFRHFTAKTSLFGT
jgi:hypothetical protein